MRQNINDPHIENTPAKSPSEPLGIFQQRKIEAEIIKPIYEAMKREFGVEKAKNIIEEAISQSALDAGRDFAKKEPNGATMASFVALQYLWKKDDALESNVQINTPERYDYRVTRCRYAEMYQALGLGEIGALLSCNRDKLFIEGYAPHIQLTRPHTLMNGDGYCDFSYADTTVTASPTTNPTTSNSATVNAAANAEPAA